MRCALEALLQSSGVTAELAFAPTPLAALVLARAGQRIEVLDPARLVSQVAPLALASLRWPGKVLERLAQMGVYTIGQALRLPRTGLARRCGVAQLASLDRLTGHAADLPARFYPRERFRRRRELIYELGDQALILKMLQPSLQQLAGFLQARQCGISWLECRLRHRHAPVTLCVLKLAEPTADEQRLSVLLGEKLLSLILPEPVRSYELRSGWLMPRAMSSHPLWRPGEQGGTAGPASPQLVEHLRARLGDESVYGLQVIAGHRPEKMWCTSEPGMHPATQPCVAFRRPLWLLPTPQLLAENAGLPQYRGTLQLLGTPERIETGWWDGGEVAARLLHRARHSRGATVDFSRTQRTASLVPAWRCSADGLGRLRRAALPQQLHFPARRFASGRAGRARLQARLCARSPSPMSARSPASCAPHAAAQSAQADSSSSSARSSASHADCASSRSRRTGRATGGCAGSSLAGGARRRRAVSPDARRRDRVGARALPHPVAAGREPDCSRRGAGSRSVSAAMCGLPSSCCCDGADRERLSAMLQSWARTLGLPLVASGDVHMHVRERAHAAGRAHRDPSQRAAREARLRTCIPTASGICASRQRLARLYPPSCSRRPCASPSAARSRSTSCATNIRDELVPPGETPASHLRKLD